MIPRSFVPAGLLLGASLSLSGVASAQSTQYVYFGHFDPTPATLRALAFEPTSNHLFVYRAFSATIDMYTDGGWYVSSLPRPGGAGDDADLEIAPLTIQLNGVTIQPGTLLFIDGSAGAAEIHAMDPFTGLPLGLLPTQFGDSAVVGGGYHALRGTFFLLQDDSPANQAAHNRVAEIDPSTGAVVQSWQTTTAYPGFDIDDGDLDIAPNGNLLIVSSSHPDRILQFSPTGQFLTENPLPAIAGGLTGLAVDDSSCDIWVASDGRITQLRSPCPSVQVLDPGCVPATMGFTLPYVAGIWNVSANGVPSQYGIALSVLGLNRVNPGLPLSALLPQGLPGCDLYVSTDITRVVFPAFGSVTIDTAMPTATWTIGVPFFHQFVLASPVAVAVTDSVRAIIGSY